MKILLHLLLVVALSLASKITLAQYELGLTREAILNLSWVKEYHQKNNYIPALKQDFMRVKTNEYHYTFGFSISGICVSQTLEARSYMGDIKLRDYLSMNAVPISTSTYIVNPRGKKFFACIVATHNDLPHQVCFSYEQIFKTNSVPRKDTFPYEIN
jgi:hypothetical protein